MGDRITVTFTVTKTDGSRLALAALDFFGAMVSGPSFNYQRVIAELTDVRTAAVENADGSYTYTFPALPAAYLAPLNDSTSLTDGELTGQALLDGTYTVGLEAYKTYTVEGTAIRDASNATGDFLFGGATTVDDRQVVTLANCDRCHSRLEAHGGFRRDVKLCLLCHTAGAEDKNVSSAAGGTPGLTIEFKVMIHKIHQGEHLPSVLGVATNPDGSRNYAATPQPYEIVGFRNSISDFSDVGFPVWPSLNQPMPRNAGYSALTAPQQATDDVMREGVVACAKCHGDPDGSGPFPAPAQGGVAYSQPSRRACGSCHDDVNWAYPYVKNTLTMPAQADDSGCAAGGCHTTTGSSISVTEAHLHPMVDPAVDAGLHINVSSVSEAGTNDGDGTIDPGEKIAVTMTITDDAGLPVAPTALASMSVVISGPTTNRSLLVNTSIPTGALTGSPPFTVNVPQPVVLEFVGDSTGGTDTFTTSRAPHLNMTGATTTVFVRTATSGGSSTLSSAAAALANYADVASVTGFARNDYLVIEDGVGGKEEYLRIALVDGSRLWFTAPLRYAHAGGSAIEEVTLTQKSVTTDYTLTAATGAITEVTEFGAGRAVVVSYTSDLIMPAVFQPPINDSPDLDETQGKWVCKPIVDGTYTVGLWASRNLVVALNGETQTYRGTSPATDTEFLVGSATEIVPQAIIDSGETCNACHNDIWFHGGGRRGWDVCILCHTIAGAEDRPRYTAASAPATTGGMIDFRSMLHKIHMGSALDHASTYTVVGFGSAAYPNNYSTNTYGEVEFPSMPSAAGDCRACHGASNTAWQTPSDRNHPTDQTSPVLAWTVACGSCHDGDDAAAHIAIQTSGGVESCEVCHGTDREFSVEVEHKVR